MKRIAQFLFQAAIALGFTPQIRQVSPQIQTRLVPIPVRGSNGFRFFGRSNGASRRRKTNRLHLSRKTRNKHR